MYAELRFTTTFDRSALRKQLIRLIGPNRASASEAVKGTILQERFAAIKKRIVAAEVVGDSASVMFFFEGNDIIIAHITAATVGQLKTQAVRLTRQLSKLVQGRRFSAEASLFTREQHGSDELILTGEFVSCRHRYVNALTSKWAARTLPTAVACFLSLTWAAGTLSALTAQITFVATAGSFLLEALFLAMTADEWKWEEPK